MRCSESSRPVFIRVGVLPGIEFSEAAARIRRSAGLHTRPGPGRRPWPEPNHHEAAAVWDTFSPFCVVRAVAVGHVLGDVSRRCAWHCKPACAHVEYCSKHKSGPCRRRVAPGPHVASLSAGLKPALLGCCHRLYLQGPFPSIVLKNCFPNESIKQNHRLCNHQRVLRLIAAPSMVPNFQSTDWRRRS